MQAVEWRFDRDQRGAAAIGRDKSGSMAFAALPMTRVFAHYADPHGVYFPGAPFLLAAMLLVVAVAISRATSGRMLRRSVPGRAPTWLTAPLPMGHATSDIAICAGKAAGEMRQRRGRVTTGSDFLRYVSFPAVAS